MHVTDHIGCNKSDDVTAIIPQVDFIWPVIDSRPIIDVIMNNDGNVFTLFENGMKSYTILGIDRWEIDHNFIDTKLLLHNDLDKPTNLFLHNASICFGTCGNGGNSLIYKISKDLGQVNSQLIKQYTIFGCNSINGDICFIGNDETGYTFSNFDQNIHQPLPFNILRPGWLLSDNGNGCYGGVINNQSTSKGITITPDGVPINQIPLIYMENYLISSYRNNKILLTRGSNGAKIFNMNDGSLKTVSTTTMGFSANPNSYAHFINGDISETCFYSFRNDCCLSGYNFEQNKLVFKKRLLYTASIPQNNGMDYESVIRVKEIYGAKVLMLTIYFEGNVEYDGQIIASSETPASATWLVDAATGNALIGSTRDFKENNSFSRLINSPTVHISPNPVSGNIVTIKGLSNSNCKIEVYTTTGVLVFSKNHIRVNSNAIELMLPDNLSGVYVLRVFNKKMDISKIIIID